MPRGTVCRRIGAATICPLWMHAKPALLSASDHPVLTWRTPHERPDQRGPPGPDRKHKVRGPRYTSYTLLTRRPCHSTTVAEWMPIVDCGKPPRSFTIAGCPRTLHASLCDFRACSQVVTRQRSAIRRHLGRLTQAIEMMERMHCLAGLPPPRSERHRATVQPADTANLPGLGAPRYPRHRE